MEKVDSFSVFWLKKLFKLIKTCSLGILLIIFIEFMKYDNVDYVSSINTEYLVEQDAIDISKATLVALIKDKNTKQKRRVKGFYTYVFGENPSRGFLSDVSDKTSRIVAVRGKRSSSSFIDIDIKSIYAQDKLHVKVIAIKGKYRYIVFLNKVNSQWKVTSYNSAPLNRV